MTELRADLPAIPTVAAFARALAGSRMPIVQHIVDAIQDSVPSYRDSSATHSITNSVAGALTVFAESLEGPSATGPKVDRLFRQLGRDEGRRDAKLADFYYALYVSVREGTLSLRAAARDFGLDADGIEHVSNAVFMFADHLADQAWAGRQAAVTRAQPRSAIRDDLLTALIEGREEAFDLADAAGWDVPELIVVLTTAGLASGSAPATSPSLLARDDGSLVLCAPEHVDQAIQHLVQAAPHKRIAISWPVAPAEVSQAHSWTRRVIAMARRGIIEPQPVLYCKDYRTEIWLHSEPALRQRLCQELLQPLLAESPNSREILSETLLAWLESRDSAPAIARKLGVHPQTIRYRWKRINELFGEDLHDPEFVVQVTMLLKASLPLWKAGDQSDFERFEAQGNASNG